MPTTVLSCTRALIAVAGEVGSVTRATNTIAWKSIAGVQVIDGCGEITPAERGVRVSSDSIPGRARNGGCGAGHRAGNAGATLARVMKLVDCRRGFSSRGRLVLSGQPREFGESAEGCEGVVAADDVTPKRGSPARRRVLESVGE